MKNTLLSFNPNFFYLIDKANNFSFKAQNFLSDTYDLQLSFKIKNELDRNLAGELINLHPREKFIFNLKGKGELNINIAKEFKFVTSKLTKLYQNNSTRAIIFNYIFEKDIPFKDEEANVENFNNFENMLCIPIFEVMVASQNISYKKQECVWNMILEEI